MIGLGIAAFVILVFLLFTVIVAMNAFEMRWAALVPASERQYPLNEPHTDFTSKFGGIFRKIPRSWTAFMSKVPPVRLGGTNPIEQNMDNPLPGTWVVAAPAYWAWMTKHHRLNYVGFRWDYNDLYYNLDATTKKV